MSSRSFARQAQRRKITHQDRRAMKLGEKLMAARDAGERVQHERLALELLTLCPDDPTCHLEAAMAHVENHRPVLALHIFEAFVRRWPTHVDAVAGRKMEAELTEGVREILTENHLGGDAIEGLAANERVQMYMEQGDWTRAYEVASAAAAKWTFRPLRNNLGRLQWLRGDLDAAVATARSVLAIEPHDLFAVCHLSQLLEIMGQRAEAREVARCLQSIPCAEIDGDAKKAETLAFLGEYLAVIEIFNAAMRRHDRAPGPTAALHHYAAFALCQLGDEASARDLWKQALKLSPRLVSCQRNLDDLAQPVGERHGPWSHEMHLLVPEPVLAELDSALQAKRAADGLVAACLSRHPHLRATLQYLLERGSPEARALAVAVARHDAQLEPSLAACARGKAGTDRSRMEVAVHLVSRGVLTPHLTLWIKGEWTPLLLWAFEIDAHASAPHPPRVRAFLRQALQLHGEGRFAEALEALDEALNLAPDAPDLLNNRALFLKAQGRTFDSTALLREVHRRHPSYIFAAVSVSRMEMLEGRLDEARRILDGLFCVNRLHVKELVAVCKARIQLAIFERDPNLGREWRRLWLENCPEMAEEARRYPLTAGSSPAALQLLEMTGVQATK